MPTLPNVRAYPLCRDVQLNINDASSVCLYSVAATPDLCTGETVVHKKFRAEICFHAKTWKPYQKIHPAPMNPKGCESCSWTRDERCAGVQDGSTALLTTNLRPPYGVRAERARAQGWARSCVGRAVFLHQPDILQAETPCYGANHGEPALCRILDLSLSRLSRTRSKN